MAVAVFAGHIMAALYTLICDVVEHHPVPRMILMLNAVQCTRLMIAAIRAIKNGDLKTHQTLMFLVYIYSTEGAGTIWQVENFMWMLGCSPSTCQSQYNSKATFYVGSYTLRLIFIRILSYFHLLCIATLRRDVGMRRYVVYESRNFVYALTLLYLSWYFFGLGKVGTFIENGGYVILAICEAFSPTTNVHALKI